ncbi:hypothetical protein GLYMA_12G141200v4 [Glycine max]|uniref:Uncharacterized protein n=1 Tax=Glycine max TaxID=3847 RepID=A0A0R0HFN2_SOYBN|nr:hypothetical protein GYH30_033696 [Glycine max]KRH25947.1 hypothetical protein GLYMA_12G141200v4 [Glycine max]
MDLLCNAYSNASDHEDEEEEPPKRQRVSLSSPNPLKRHLPLSSHPSFNHQTQAPMPGRYISKRQRALMAPPLPLFLTRSCSVSIHAIWYPFLLFFLLFPLCNPN